jgi:hypothetical protein
VTSPICARCGKTWWALSYGEPGGEGFRAFSFVALDVAQIEKTTLISVY